jgi:hypothetical protein
MGIMRRTMLILQHQRDRDAGFRDGAASPNIVIDRDADNPKTVNTSIGQRENQPRVTQ